MKKKYIIGALLLILAASVLGYLLYKSSLKKKVLALYGSDTDLSGKGIRDLKQMITVYNNQQDKP